MGTDQINRNQDRAGQSGLSFQVRNTSLPHSQRKRKQKPNYEGMTKDQIKQLKKEKRSRKEWDKYKEKLIEKRNEVTKIFHNNYYWNSYVVSHNKPTTNNTSGMVSPKNMTTASQMHLRDAKYANDKSVDISSVAHSVDKDGNEIYTVHLQEMITDSCGFYEKMESKKEGSIETMLTGLRNQIDKGKVNIDRSYKYDPNR